MATLKCAAFSHNIMPQMLESVGELVLAGCQPELLPLKCMFIFHPQFSLVVFLRIWQCIQTVLKIQIQYNTIQYKIYYILL